MEITWWQCSCGSGLVKRVHYDAHGIFLTYTCKKCHAERMKRLPEELLAGPDHEHDEGLQDE